MMALRVHFDVLVRRRDSTEFESSQLKRFTGIDAPKAFRLYRESLRCKIPVGGGH